MFVCQFCKKDAREREAEGSLPYGYVFHLVFDLVNGKIYKHVGLIIL
jgi:hypothetical protein